MQPPAIFILASACVQAQAYRVRAHHSPLSSRAHCKTSLAQLCSADAGPHGTSSAAPARSAASYHRSCALPPCASGGPVFAVHRFTPAAPGFTLRRARDDSDNFRLTELCSLRHATCDMRHATCDTCRNGRGQSNNVVVWAFLACRGCVNGWTGDKSKCCRWRANWGDDIGPYAAKQFGFFCAAQ